MTAHLHSTFQDWCYRCHLSRDEERDMWADIAREFWDAKIRPTLLDLPDPDLLRDGYVKAALDNPEALDQLLAWEDTRYDAQEGT